MNIRKFFFAIRAFLRASSFVIGSVICFFITLYLAIMDHVAAGGLVAALFVMLVLFHYLPQMEYFQALGVKAKWSTRLSEADKILKTLKQTAKSSSRLTYHTLAWGPRLGGTPRKILQDMADEADQMLDAIGVDETEKTFMKRDYLNFAAQEAHFFFLAIVLSIVENNISLVQLEIGQLGDEADSQNGIELKNKLDALKNSTKQIAISHEDDMSKFREYCHNQIPKEALSDEDTTTLA